MTDSEHATVGRERAAEHRRLAAETTLPNIKAMHLRSAAMWDEVADQADRLLGISAANRIAKLAEGG